jgi:hypothetical protein
LTFAFSLTSYSSYYFGVYLVVKGHDVDVVEKVFAEESDRVDWLVFEGL